MRFVPTNCLREGMVLAKTLRGQREQTLLASGTTIKLQYIQRIKELGYSGVYIQDDLSSDIEIQNVISDELRLKTVRGIKNTFNKTAKNKPVTAELEDMRGLVNNIVDEIIQNKDLMVNLVDLRAFDDYLFFHSVNVTVLSVLIGVDLNLSGEELFKLGLGALFHDVGKVFVDKTILDKKTDLSQEEFDEIRKHPFLGYDYLKNKLQSFPITSYTVAFQHHERFDGSGYPRGLDGKGIFNFARIVALADVYDAMTSKTARREALPPFEAIEFIMGNTGTLFDPEIARVFLRKVSPYPLGTCVYLSDGSIGIVLENYEDCCTRPRVRVVYPADKGGQELDMRNDFKYANITITGVAEM